MKIKWFQNDTKIYGYGANIQYRVDGSVVFESLLMPPGEAILNWRSNMNYSATRSGLKLPLLQQHRQYEISLQAQSLPEASIFLQVSFFSKYNETIKEEIITRKAIITYPEGAYWYAIKLINKRAECVIFDSISIEEKNESN